MTEQRRPFNLRGHLILVVEDDYFVADDLCRELEDQGANVLGPRSPAWRTRWRCSPGRSGLTSLSST